jgi:hypothetical protein
MVDELAAVIARGVADGSVRADRDPRAEALHIVSAVRGLGYLWVLDRDSFGDEHGDEHLRAVIADRLAPAVVGDAAVSPGRSAAPGAGGPRTRRR